MVMQEPTGWLSDQPSASERRVRELEAENKRLRDALEEARLQFTRTTNAVLAQIDAALNGGPNA